MLTTFAKVHSGGRDFIVVNKAQSTAADLPAMARRYCPQRAGVGAAGLAIFAHQGRARFVARYFDRDGKESPAEDCVLRSCARVINLQYGYQAATLVAAGAVYESRTSGDQVGLRFPPPRDIIGPFAVERHSAYGIWIGSNNIVVFADNVADIDPGTEKIAIRSCSPLVMTNARINFAEILGDASLRIRTFDWEVGPETISSGPGALAAAVVAYRIGLCGRDRIEVQTRSGSTLAVQADGDCGEGQWLYGPAVFTFSGELPSLFGSATSR
jgi:diaminopimelate epimerase